MNVSLGSVSGVTLLSSVIEDGTEVSSIGDEGSGFESNVVDDEVEVFGSEFDTRERDFLEGTEESGKENLRYILPEVSSSSSNEVDTGLGKVESRFSELLASVSEGDERLVVGGTVEELLRFADRVVGILLPSSESEE